MTEKKKRGRPVGSRHVIEDRFDIMPLSEIAQRLLKYRSSPQKPGLGWNTIAMRVGIRRNTPRWIATGVYEERIIKNPKARMSDNQQRLLSRVLWQLETGELTYSFKPGTNGGGQWHQQEATKLLPRVSRLVMVGGVTKVQHAEIKGAGAMPSFGSLFNGKVGQELPKHLVRVK